MLSEPTVKVAADIEAPLAHAFETKVYKNKKTKREVLERLMRDYLLNDEEAPRGFPRAEIHKTMTTKRRPRV